MNKKYTYLIIVVLVSLVIITCCLYLIRANKKTSSELTLNESDVTLIKTLKTEDGTVLGDINVVSLHSASPGPLSGESLDDVFTELYVTKEVDGNNIILYKVNSNGFFNTLGRDLEISESGFYGYQFAAIYDDHFVLHLLTNDGKNTSDDVTVVWNTNKEIFEIYRIQVEDYVGELTSQDKSSLGEIYVAYLDRNKDIIDSLFIVKKTPGTSEGMYMISRSGFYNQNGIEKDISKDDFRGFKLVRYQDDYLVIRFVIGDKGLLSDDVTVKWNYDKKIFEETGIGPI